MQSAKNFILPTLLLVVVIQISYVLGTPTNLRPTLTDPDKTAELNSAVKNPLEKADLRLLRHVEVEDESDPQPRQRRHHHYGGGFGYNGGGYGYNGGGYGYNGYNGGGYGYNGYNGGGYGLGW